jgi:hypothetical protein
MCCYVLVAVSMQSSNNLILAKIYNDKYLDVPNVFVQRTLVRLTNGIRIEEGFYWLIIKINYILTISR